MKNLELTLACGDYDRTRPLWDGSVRPEGIDLRVLLLPVEEIFLRAVRYQEFEVTELSMSSFLITWGKLNPGYVGIPVFPSRKFRHGDIYIRRDSPVQKPEDLRGGRIGLPEYQMTAAVWMRGFLEEDFGLAPHEMEWVTADEERFPIKLPPSIRKRVISRGENLFDLLRDGKLEALFTARVPPALRRGENWIARLFPDFKEVERQYYRRTEIFPIMHTVALRRDIYGRYPWAAQSLYRAFCQAKERAIEQASGLGAPPVTLPWFFHEIEETMALMGKDFWPYGLSQNIRTLEKLIAYMAQQALIPSASAPSVKELFAPNIL